MCQCRYEYQCTRVSVSVIHSFQRSFKVLSWVTLLVCFEEFLPSVDVSDSVPVRVSESL